MKNQLFKRYLGRSIFQATAFVLVGFLSMFLFFDFLAELDNIGSGGYRFQYALMYVVLGLPSHVVEIAPIAVLIGSLWALSQSAANSEFTVFRVSGLLPGTAVAAMLRIGLPMVILTALFSEVVAPFSEEFRGRVRDGFASASSGPLRSGLWLRDSSDPSRASSKAIRFMNAGKFSSDQVLQRVQIYDFDSQQRLARTIDAPKGRYVGRAGQGHEWELESAKVVEFADNGQVSQRTVDRLSVISMLAPDTLGALVTNPDRMGSLDLYRYVAYLKENKQKADRYEIALWKRLVYPFVVWVMMLLALPAAFIQSRAGAVGARVFAGILGGVSFHLINSLFSHLGVLNTWPAPIMAMLPSVMALLVAGFLFYRVQYR